MPKTATLSANQSRGKTRVSRILPARKRESVMGTTAVSHLEGYSPRTDPAVFVQQLESIPLSHVRDEPITCKNRRLHLVSSFRELRVAAPVPSKRFRHRIPPPPPQQQQQQQQQQESPPPTSSSSPQPPSPLSQHQERPSDVPPTTHTTPAQRNYSINTPTNTTHRRGPEYAYPRESLRVPLLLDPPIQEEAFESEKAMEKEYWRRQRRVFLRSRFITNEEATAIANGVYKAQPVSSTDRMVVTFQANIANFRSKWRKVLKELARKFTHITKAQVTAADAGPVEQEIRSKVDQAALDRVWGHWLSEPFVDKRVFYANTHWVDTLTSVTVQAICVTLKYNHGLFKERDFRKHLDDLDKYTRNLDLPDPLVGSNY